MFFLAVPVFLSGCIASTEALLELTEKNSGETIRPEVGDFFMLRLPETAGTGYLWQTASPPYSSDVLRCLEDTFVPNPASAGMADSNIAAPGRRIRLLHRHLISLSLPLAIPCRRRIFSGNPSRRRRTVKFFTGPIPKENASHWKRICSTDCLAVGAFSFPPGDFS